MVQPRCPEGTYGDAEGLSLATQCLNCTGGKLPSIPPILTITRTAWGLSSSQALPGCIYILIRSLSHDPIDYVRLTMNISLDYGITVTGRDWNTVIILSLDWLHIFQHL